jgi:O-antigen ligase
MDGQAATMAFVIAGTTALMGLLGGEVWLAVTGAALAGACLGFLPHNLASPARVFLGDGGSMPIGFALAALVMVGAGEAAPEWQALAMGVLLVGVPAIDTGLVMISRRRRGVSILTGGQDHLTHRTHKRLRTTRAVALALGGGQALLATLALVSYRGGSVLLLVVVLAYLVGAGTLIALLDARTKEPAVVTHEASVAPPPQQRPGRPPWEAMLLVPLALLLALSPFAAGYYDSSVWAPSGLVLIVVLVAVLIARPPRLARAAVVALTGLAALAVWSLASALWAQSIQQAVLDANRLLLYAVLLALLLVLVRSTRAALWLVGALAMSAAVYVIVEYVRLSAGGGSSLFLAGRLDQPLGYINGLAAFHLLALWPALALAERRKHPVLAALGLGLAVLIVALLLLSQSRGAALAAGVSAIVLLALVPGRLRRACALLALSGAVALLAGPATAVYTSGLGGSVDDGLLQELTSRAVLVAAALGLAWGAATRIVARVQNLRPLRNTTAAGLGCMLVFAAGAGLVKSGWIAGAGQRHYDAFVHLGASDGGEMTGSRLVSGAGNRYDYWRIAVGEWKEHKLLGVGAGNYERRYFVERRTTEDIRQPHSLQLQTLSELGLVGGGLLVVFLSGVGWTIWRRRAAAQDSDVERFLLVAASGAFSAWLVHASVDWIHLLPGITAITLAAAAVLMRPVANSPSEPDSVNRDPRARTLAMTLAVAAALVLTGVSLSRQVLVEHYAGHAAAALATDPAKALGEANQALRLAPEQIPAYYTKAAALARFGDAAGARTALLEALAQDRGKYVTWALLGDLAVRAGDQAQARANYREALQRNPRDPGLRQLVRDPEAALRVQDVRR